MATFADDKVWERDYASHTKLISRRRYMLLICTWTAAGIAFSAWTASFSQDWQLQHWGKLAYISFSVAVLAVSFLGSLIANASDNVAVSAFGYALVSGPFGLLLGPYMAMYKTSSVVKVFVLTSAVVLILGLAGAMIPDDLAAWGTPLLGALLLLIGGYLVVPLLSSFGLPIHGAMTLLDWAGLLVFGALILFDLNRAMRIPYTHDNAVDVSVEIYLDFINILIRLLDLVGDDD